MRHDRANALIIQPVDPGVFKSVVTYQLDSIDADAKSAVKRDITLTKFHHPFNKAPASKTAQHNKSPRFGYVGAGGYSERRRSGTKGGFAGNLKTPNFNASTGAASVPSTNRPVSGFASRGEATEHESPFAVRGLTKTK